ncbi:hypothetical protein [Methyloglobulus sp.]|uniref:hypothetical protein n=1 Tax=Methyloglobulus sp. TaxID=2518622 RepID=UPI0032B71F38
MKRLIEKLVDFIALISFFILCSCSSLVEKGRLPEVTNRISPSLQLSSEITILDKEVTLIKSLVSNNGHAHVFALDNEGRLSHTDIQGNQIQQHHEIGKVELGNAKFIDAIELTNNQYRILAGDTQYIVDEAGRILREIKGNKCERFLPIGDKLFCSFIISGKEAGAPERTDVTGGIFFILPFVFWSTEQATKLVLAEETANGWLIKAVVDPNIKPDTSPDYVVQLDNQGILHIVYYTTGGGGFFAVGGGGNGGVFVGSESNLRYAQLQTSRLMDRNLPVSSDKSHETNNGWLAINGANLDWSQVPFFDYDSGGVGGASYFASRFTPLTHHLSIDPVLGDLSFSISGAMSFDGLRKVYIYHGGRLGGLDDLWLEFRNRKSQWDLDFTTLVTNDIPTKGYEWNYIYNGVKNRIDRSGVGHIIVFSKKSNYLTIEYLQKNNQNWSLPIKLGNCEECRFSDFAVSQHGNIFVYWTNDQDKLIGRWIRKSQAM